jgi:hypothetical protein
MDLVYEITDHGQPLFFRESEPFTPFTGQIRVGHGKPEQRRILWTRADTGMRVE